MENIILMTDSYKHSHYKQYPPGIETVYSYLEAREGGAFPEVVWFGLQYYLIKYLQGQVVTKEKIQEAEEICAAHFNNPNLFNKSGWTYILEKHKGRLPVSIKAVPEGTPVGLSNVLLTIENTDPACYWLTNFLETLLVQCWYGSTVATQSREMKMVLLHYLEETGDPSLIDFKLHDFGFRGVSSVETAGMGGCAHLVNFKGTDTMEALMFAKKYYNCPMAGYSIPAAEHSTICAWGRDKEIDAYRNMLKQFPTGLVSVVSDSYDVNAVCKGIWGHLLKQEVLNRNGTLIIRPDSGDPVDMAYKVIGTIGIAFGHEKNNKGYYVMNPKVRVIQGDGIDMPTMKRTLELLKNRKWSADNISFGSGGGLLQKLNRDTLKFAFKCSSVRINGIDKNVFKNPITDSTKKSKSGKLKLVHNSDNKFYTKQLNEPGEDYMIEVFRDGEILHYTTLEEIRHRAFVE